MIGIWFILIISYTSHIGQRKKPFLMSGSASDDGRLALILA
jgi:hypothetical protein